MSQPQRAEESVKTEPSAKLFVVPQVTPAPPTVVKLRIVAFGTTLKFTVSKAA